jgi:hypothetical protein
MVDVESTIEDSRTFNGKKYMWDGKIYNEVDAKHFEDTYKKDGFEVKVVKHENNYLVYTRRVVKEVVVSPQ